jgi:hypothetical protein
VTPVAATLPIVPVRSLPVPLEAFSVASPVVPAAVRPVRFVSAAGPLVASTSRMRTTGVAPASAAIDAT